MKNPNPPRQAIALKYDGSHAPTLTAKGDEALAEAILKIARDCEVPIYENAEIQCLTHDIHLMCRKVLNLY